uniref:Uncharacterized protein n=1 Tax=Picea sitchensis TaxID=3332 RepID=A0A6B9XPG9_PICSI|nr:hypothetical protein Q903MT_gene3852 [Picea sitchensis]
MDQPDQQNMGLIQEWDLGMGLDLFYQWPMPGLYLCLLCLCYGCWLCFWCICISI